MFVVEREGGDEFWKRKENEAARKVKREKREIEEKMGNKSYRGKWNNEKLGEINETISFIRVNDFKIKPLWIFITINPKFINQWIKFVFGSNLNYF